MTDQNFTELLKQIGTIGIAQYVHLECEKEFLKSLVPTGKTIDPSRSISWKPRDLIGQYTDITHCDYCGSEFVETDSEYRSFWVTTQDQLNLISENAPQKKKPRWKLW